MCVLYVWKQGRKRNLLDLCISVRPRVNDLTLIQNRFVNTACAASVWKRAFVIKYKQTKYWSVKQSTKQHLTASAVVKQSSSIQERLYTVSLMTMVSHMKINVKINELPRCVWFCKKVHLLLSSLRSLDLHSSQTSSTTLWKIVLLFKSVADIPLQMLVTHQYLNPPFSSALYFFINFTPHGIVIVLFFFQ